MYVHTHVYVYAYMCEYIYIFFQNKYRFKVILCFCEETSNAIRIIRLASHLKIDSSPIFIA